MAERVSDEVAEPGTVAAQGSVYAVNVSGPLRDVEFAGHTVRTGFFKKPVEGKVQVHTLGLEGDAQADLTVHGGPQKAVYFYPREHYAGWEEVLGMGTLPSGSFGENITSRGLLESDVCIGDVLQVGTARLQVTQPRSPCYKLQIRFARADVVALFAQRGLPGWYVSVLNEGGFEVGDPISVVSRAPERISIAEVWRYGLGFGTDVRVQERIARLELLPSFWKNRFTR